MLPELSNAHVPNHAWHAIADASSGAFVASFPPAQAVSTGRLFGVELTAGILAGSVSLLADRDSDGEAMKDLSISSRRRS